MSPKRSERWNRIRPALLGLAGLLLFVSPGFGQFSVNPVVIDIPNSDSLQAVEVEVRNEGEDPLGVRLYMVDFDRDEKGDHRFSEPGSTPQSCAQRITVEPEALMVEPGEISRALLRISGATDPAACWSMVFAESNRKKKGNLLVSQRIGIKVFGLPVDGVADGELIDAAVHQGDDGVEVTFEFDNYGSMPLRPAGSLEIRTLDGRTVVETPIALFGVLPGTRRTMEVKVSEPLPPGEYLALPILDFGADYLAGMQVAFTVP